MPNKKAKPAQTPSSADDLRMMRVEEVAARMGWTVRTPSASAPWRGPRITKMSARRQGVRIDHFHTARRARGAPGGLNIGPPRALAQPKYQTRGTNRMQTIHKGPRSEQRGRISARKDIDGNRMAPLEGGAGQKALVMRSNGIPYALARNHPRGPRRVAQVLRIRIASTPMARELATGTSKPSAHYDLPTRPMRSLIRTLPHAVAVEIEERQLAASPSRARAAANGIVGTDFSTEW
jgi:hypothetical protein